MKKHFRTAACIAMTSFIGCIQIFPIVGSGNPAEQTYALTGFSKVDISNGCNVTISKSDTFSVSVTIDDNLTQFLNVKQNGTVLSIGLDNLHIYNSSNFKATISCPGLDGAMVSGGSKITADNYINDKNISVSLSGGSIFDGGWTCENLTANLSGGSIIELTGFGNNLNLDFSGGSIGHLKNFTTTDAHANLSGGSIAYIFTNGPINGDLSGGSQLHYSGNSTVSRVSVSGGSFYSRN